MLQMQLKRMQDDTEYRFQQLGAQGGPPPAAGSRAAVAPAHGRCAAAARTGQRSDVFDPSRIPMRPARRARSATQRRGRAAADRGERAAGRRARRPRGRRAARSVDACRHRPPAPPPENAPADADGRRRRHRRNLRRSRRRRATPAQPARSLPRCRHRPRRRTNTTSPMAMCCTRTMRWPSRPSAIS